MLLKVHHDDTSPTKRPRLENMLVGQFDEMALFLQKIRERGNGQNADNAVVEVRYSGVGKEGKGILEVPLVPEIEGLDVVDVVLHGSATKAYRMGEIYDRWFSACFGYEVSWLFDLFQARRRVHGSRNFDEFNLGDACLLGTSLAVCSWESRSQCG